MILHEPADLAAWAARSRLTPAPTLEIYVDTSRPGRRRWCSMEHCGNRHKVRALRARNSQEG